MNRITLYILICSLVVLIGCASTHNYQQMSEGSGVPLSVLEANCSGITCTYDKLKDRVQASASDMNLLFALNGNESRTIQFTWVSGSDSIHVDLFSVALYGSWSFIKSAEIYVSKEMIAEVSGSIDRVVGTYNSIAKEVEKVEVVSGYISLDSAMKIAEAPYEAVTIRFYGKNGYTDSTLPRQHKLINVVKIAKSIL